MAQYAEHYDAQLGGGGGGGGIENFYRGASYQRGHGIGSFLGGLFRKVLPLLTRGARAVGKEVLRTGMNVMTDMESNVPFKESLKTRAMESGRTLQQKAQDKVAKLMKGSGYKGATGTRGSQLLLARVNRLISARGTAKTRKVSKRKTANKKKKKTGNKKKTNRSSGGKAAKTNKKKKRSITDIFGPR